ncbi:MAG TPA: tetratricopeptide repeat protein [bacterium]|nr:tetratricopeptide repeat protein [bacterium]
MRRPAFVILLCALVAALVYVPTLRYPLVWDDVDIIVQNQSSPLQAFTHSFWYGGGAGVLGKDPYYRPLVNFSVGVDKLVAGHRAWYFHLVNLLLHSAVVALAVVVVWQLFGSLWSVLLAGMLCAVHPFAADSVAYVSGRTDLLACIGLLVALLGLLRLRKRRDWPAILLVWGGFIFGVLSKETAAAFVVVAGVWVLTSSRPKGLRRSDWIALAGLAVLLGGYLVARRAVLGSVLAVPGTTSVGAVVLLSLSNFGRLLLATAAPFGQRVFLWNQAGAGRAILFAVVGALYLALPLLLPPVRRSANAWLAWLWGAALLLPFAGLVGFGPAGRLVYIPGLGLVLLLLLGGRRLTRGNRYGQVIAVVATFGYCALMVVFVQPQRVRVWRDGYTLFQQMTKEAPSYPGSHFNYAFELRNRGDVDGAIAEYRTAIALDSSMALAYSNLGALLQSKGRLAEAESLYLKTIELRPTYSLAWNNLAVVRYRRGDGLGSISAFRKAMELKPNDASVIYNLGRVYQQAGIADSAAGLFERAYRLEPGNLQIRASYEQTHGSTH